MIYLYVKFNKNEITGFYTQTGREIKSSKIILTTGTFLNGLIRIGQKTFPAGRHGQKPTIELAHTLKAHFKMGRLKTGTPARIKKESIDYSSLQEQKGDAPPVPFSYLNFEINVPQISCYITHTTQKTHDLINKNLHLSAVKNGANSKGPRYCPSIEDKITRFSQKQSHQNCIQYLYSETLL